MDVRITPGTEDDLGALERLYDALNDHLAATVNYPGWKKGIYPVRADAEADIAARTLYVATVDGALAGSIVLNHEPEQPPVNGAWQVDAADAEVLSIHRFCVHPAYLRRGIGGLLLAFADAVAKSEGMKAIRLDVYEGNSAAIRAYEKSGYAYIDTVDLGLEQFGLKWFKLYEKVIFAGQ